jgi:hypothetical protein
MDFCYLSLNIEAVEENYGRKKYLWGIGFFFTSFNRNKRKLV